MKSSKVPRMLPPQVGLDWGRIGLSLARGMAWMLLAFAPLSGLGCSNVDAETVATIDPVPASCPDFTPEAGIKHEVSGRLGTFTDHCDANGDLVEYQCLLVSQTLCEGEYCSEVWSKSDEVEPSLILCGGTCHDGRCVSRCPSNGSQVEFQAISMDGSATVASLETGGLLSCQLSNHTFESEEELEKFMAGALTVDLLGGQDHLCLPGNPDQMTFIDGTTQTMPSWDCIGQ